MSPQPRQWLHDLELEVAALAALAEREARDMPAHMNTESRRKASATYHAKREAEGLKKVTLWLSPAAREKLEALKAEAGSKDKAAELAILAYGEKPKPEPVSVSVPLAGTFDRKPLQKAAKRNK